MRNWLILLIMVVFCSNAYAKMPLQELSAEFEKCQQQKTSECYRLLYSKSQNNIVRYAYGVSLYNEKRFQEARRELSNFAHADKENPQLVQNANALIANIDERYRSQVKAGAADQGNYLKEIKQTAKWQNPNNIKVYIKPHNGKEALFRRALQTWDNRLLMIHFSFQNTPDNADIQCSFVDFIKKGVAGVTEFSGFLANVKTGERYFNPPVTISISLQDSNSGRPYTDSELQSIILHEVGHALGILDHTQNKNDIMFFSTETYKNSQISNRDVNTIKEIYK